MKVTEPSYVYWLTILLLQIKKQIEKFCTKLNVNKYN